MAASLVRKISGPLTRCLFQPSTTNQCVQRSFSNLCKQVEPAWQFPCKIAAPCQSTSTNHVSSFTGSLLKACLPVFNTARGFVRYSRRRGKPKTIKSVVNRFYRLDWGIYIRPRAGRHKHRWKKPEWMVERGKFSVFCNKQQSRMLDKMTTQYWKKKRHYIDDPYAPYNQRTGMPGHYKPPKCFP